MSSTAISIDLKFVPEKIRSQAEAAMPRAQKALQQLIDKTCVGPEWTGWFDYPRHKGFELDHEIQQVVSKLRLPYDTVVVIGIGGSYLGTRAVADALTHDFAVAMPGAASIKPIVYAGHHLAGSGLRELLDFLETRQPIVNVISKSGTTTEPSIAFRVLREYLEKRYGAGEAAQRILATTDPSKGALRTLAKAQGYPTFEVPADIGGRYSVFSAVGLLPLALAGFSCKDFLRGADQVYADLRAGGGGSATQAVLKYATTRFAAYQNNAHVELLSYTDPKLRCLVEWWKQLYGESEGKQGKGLFPAGLAYTTDLHSLGQFVQEGRRNLIETFLSFDDAALVRATDGMKIPKAADNADELGYLAGESIDNVNTLAMRATMVAHFDGGVPCIGMQLPALNITTLGAIMAFFMTACAVSAALLEVNPFDQPGVEAYKKNLFGLLGKPGFEALGKAVKERLS